MRYRHLLITAVLVIVAVLTSVVVMANPSAQGGCVVRSDWPTYTVVRGDTLARIARQYNTTYVVLAAANCISSPWRIYAGQRLRVPPTGGSGSAPPEIHPSIPSSFQLYENGFMIWRGNTGHIWAFSNDGRVLSFPSQTYGQLPENRISPPPAGRFAPIMGFGRVWGNIAEVRARLGWATISERGYMLAVQSFGAGGITYVTIPTDTRWIQINPNNTWVYTSGVRPISTPIPIPVNTPIPGTDRNIDVWGAFQQFENGFMTWRSDTSEIVVYFGVEGGGVTYYPSVIYGGLPDNPIFNPPAGRIRPIHGFGKVWGNYNMLGTLGWATDYEHSYIMQVRYVSPDTFTFNLPDGRRVSNINNYAWSYLSGNLIPPSATPTQTPTQPADVVITTQAAFQAYTNGFMIWRGDTQQVLLFYGHRGTAVYDYSAYGGLPDNPYGGDTPDGMIRPANAFGRVWGNFSFVRDTMGWAMLPEEGYTMTITTRPDAVFYSTPDGRHARHQLGTGLWTYENP